jgi:hypothetical protein
MSIEAQMEASRINAELSAGPRTEAGETISVLFATQDFIRPSEEDHHASLQSMANEQYCPVGLLECTLVDEMVRAMWRLRRCGQVESSFIDTLTAESGPMVDPMQNEATARLQNSVDRARAQAHRLLHRCMQELRNLQTERHYRNEVTEAGTDLTWFGICDLRKVRKGAAEGRTAALRHRRNEVREQFELLKRSMELPDAQPNAGPDPDHTHTAEAPLTERTQSSGPQTAEIARNSQCPCNSGRKYKRCCGVNAPALRCAA